MTVQQIFDSARVLLGYSLSPDSAAEYPFLKDALFIFNCAYFDLCGKTAENLTLENSVSPAELDALPYGVAMLIATYAGDTARQHLLTDIYNAKRARTKSAVLAIKDVMP